MACWHFYQLTQIPGKECAKVNILQCFDLQINSETKKGQIKSTGMQIMLIIVSVYTLCNFNDTVSYYSNLSRELEEENDVYK